MYYIYITVLGDDLTGYTDLQNKTYFNHHEVRYPRCVLSNN